MSFPSQIRHNELLAQSLTIGGEDIPDEFWGK